VCYLRINGCERHAIPRNTVLANCARANCSSSADAGTVLGTTSSCGQCDENFGNLRPFNDGAVFGLSAKSDAGEYRQSSRQQSSYTRQPIGDGSDFVDEDAESSPQHARDMTSSEDDTATGGGGDVYGGTTHRNAAASPAQHGWVGARTCSKQTPILAATAARAGLSANAGGEELPQGQQGWIGVRICGVRADPDPGRHGCAYV
jgi:hypothetical protein